jgi:hypothetical protein
MSSHEENHEASNTCSDNSGSAKYSPCACCVALAQVRFPHYHHDSNGVPYQYPYAEGYAPPLAAKGAHSCPTCGQSENTLAASNVTNIRSEMPARKKSAGVSGFLSNYLLSKSKSEPSTRDSNSRETKRITTPEESQSDSQSADNAEPAASSTGDVTDAAAASEEQVTDHGTDWPAEEHEVKILKPRRIWHGLDGIAITLFGILIPGAMFFLTCLSMPKRVTLVLLNHPIETILEMALVVAIPLINYIVWSALCANKIRFPRLSSLGLGVAAGSSLIITVLCLAGMFASNAQMVLDSGSDFATGFSWIACLSLLAGSGAAYSLYRVRATREFPRTKKQVALYSAIGALLPVLIFAASEARPWAIRIAERMTASGTKAERKQGMSLLRQLNPERELRMECSDPRAAGICGLFIPVKPSSQHELYFSLTGKPYSFREFNNTDLSSMPDDYLSRNVVGEQIEGLSLTRSTLTGVVHPRTMSATLNWTFVFKNDTANPQEARAEIGLPPGALITGLTAWTKGEAQEATFVASGKAEGVSNWSEAGHNSPAIATDLGHGRVLMHCYPVPQEEESKVSVRMVVPLNPDRSKSASIIMPKFIATNFGFTDGEYSLRIRGSEVLTSGIKSLKSDRTAGGECVISGNLSKDDLKSNKLLIDTQRGANTSAIAVFDQQAWKMAKDEHKRLEEIAKEKARENNKAVPSEQVIVMVDGSKGLNNQLDAVRKALAQKVNPTTKKTSTPSIKPIPARYVVETVERVSAAAPKHLVVVVDGSSTTKEYSEQICTALSKLPAGIRTTLMLASQENEKLAEPMKLSEGLNLLKSAQFLGGQDNLKSVVKAAELAGEAKGGAVLWIHGPQPVLNQEIYIMAPYTAAPAFYETTLGTGDTDSYEFFKNHPEVGPFTAIPRNADNVGNDMTAFFGRWTPDDSSYAIKLAMTTKKPDNTIALSREEKTEVLTLHAAQRCLDLISSKRMHMAAELAVRYGFVSPVSSALVSSTTPTVHEGEGVDAFSNPSGMADEKLASGEGDQSRSAGGLAGAPQPKAAAQEQEVSSEADGAAPMLQGASNGTIGPQSGDATVVSGVNTAGTVRVNNLANLEALLNIIANLAETGLGLAGVVLVIHGIARGVVTTEIMGQEIEISPGKRITIGVAMVLIGLAVPGMINWFVASARDANLFS